MLDTLKIFCVIVVALAMVPAVAHALELPGKLRLDKESYFAVQRIYYPGFTIAGGAEPIGAILTGILLLMVPRATMDFWLTLVALVGLLSMQAVYWLLIHPINRTWVQGQSMGKAGSGFFSVGNSGTEYSTDDWENLRDRWEYAHVARSGLVAFSFIALVIVMT